MRETLLYRLRYNERLSQFAVGRVTGIREQHLGQYEKRKSICFPKYRKALADFFGVAESTLFDEQGFAREVEV